MRSTGVAISSSIEAAVSNSAKCWPSSAPCSRLYGVCGAALRNRTAKKARRCRAAKQHACAHATRRFAGDRHLLRIAAEGVDVIAHPLQRGNLVAYPVEPRAGVLGAADRFELREAESPEAIVE